MADNRSSNSAQSSAKVDLGSWKKFWPAEKATFAEARALRKRLLKRWRQGGTRQRELARIVERCRMGKRCNSAECPLCERWRRGRTQGGRVTHGSPTEVRQPAPSVILVCTSEIVPERIEWLWEGFIAIGRLTGLVGYPGLGKSQVSLDLAATVSTGRDFPGGASNGKPGHVIILSAEDGPADTIVPRLIAAGADLSRIHIVKAVKDSNGERPFNLSVDLDRLEREYDLRRVKLVVIDPASSYLGSANRNTGRRCPCHPGSPGQLRRQARARRSDGVSSEQEQRSQRHHADHGLDSSGSPCRVRYSS